jgi:uncharacterized protein YbjT (DUF2867 family)
MGRVLVAGATGHIGREVVAGLRDIGRSVRALTRDPQSANLPADVEVVRADLTAPDTLDHPLTDVDAVFLVWVVPLEPAAAAIDRIARHTSRIVLLTAPHRTAHPFFQQPNPMKSVQIGVERLIETSGLQWTFVRPHMFAGNCVNWWGPQIRSGDVVRWFYGDVATAPIDERDVAAVAIRALCDEGHHGREYVITGPESLTQRAHVKIIGEALGRLLRFHELSHAEARQELVSVGWPAAAADMLLNAYAASVNLPSHVTSTVADVTGSPARTFRDWAIEHAAAFAAQ